MLELMSEETRAHLLAFPTKKKLAFLVLLYERMIPELRSFCIAERRDFSIFQEAHNEFWKSFADGKSSISWPQLRRDIIDATPNTEDFGTLEGSYALNAGLVAADIAAFIADGEDGHIIEAAGYAFDSLDFKVGELGMSFSDRTAAAHVDDYVMAHPLGVRESQVEEADVSFLATLPDGQWPADTIAMLRHRAGSQSSLLDIHGD